MAAYMTESLRQTLVDARAWGDLSSGELAEMFGVSEEAIKALYIRAGCPVIPKVPVKGPTYMAHRWYVERMSKYQPQRRRVTTWQV